MSEGARKGCNFIVVCITPDICLTPLGPIMVAVPYQIVAFPEMACLASDNVKFAGEPALLQSRSMIMNVVGDEAGVGGGIKSGHNCWVVEFDHGSNSVHINGQKVVRHNDQCWMNGRNTRGKVVYVAGMGPACSISRGRPGAESRTHGASGDSGPGGVNIKGSPPPPKPTLGQQAAALKRAAQKGAPFVDT